MKRIALIGLAVVMVMISGCGTGKPLQEERFEEVFTARVSDLVSLTVGPDAEVYAGSWERGIARYDHTGELQEEYPGTEHISALHYANGYLYGFDDHKKSIVELDPESGAIRTVYADLRAAEVRSIAAAGEYLVLISIPSFDIDFTREPDGYMNFHEQFFAIHIHSGERIELAGIERPIALYPGSGGVVYVYAHSGGNYVLYSYNIKSRKASRVAEMNDVGYLFAFAYENGAFVYFAPADDGINCKRMSDGLIYKVMEKLIPLLPGGGFSYYRGNLVFVAQRPAGPDENLTPEGYKEGRYIAGEDGGIIITSLQTLRLGPEFVVPADPQKREAGDKVVISAAAYSRHLSLNVLRERSGITGVYVSQPTSDYEQYLEFLTSILAGDDSVDIYILFSADAVSNALRDQTGFVPLTASAPVQDYLEQCFDWIGEAARTRGGEIWMLPLYADLPVLWYVPENFDRFGLTPADVETFDSYRQTIQRLNQEKGRYTTHTWMLSGFEALWFLHYESLHCDYENGVVNFNTDLFRHFFGAMWSGWIRYGPVRENALHPIFQYDAPWRSTHETDTTYIDEDDAGRVIFKLDNDSSNRNNRRMDMAEWRVLPMPRLTEEVTRNYTSTFAYAVINPYSRNPETAMAYLEAAAEDMLPALTQPSFMRKDTSAYDGYFDMTLPVMQDLYAIYRDGTVVFRAYPQYERNSLIDDYQAGHLTLQQAIDELQRKAEMWLHE